MAHDRAALRRLLATLPKGGELHTHLSGLPTPDDLLALAAAPAIEERLVVRVPRAEAAATDPAAWALVPIALDPPPDDVRWRYLPPAAIPRDPTLLRLFRAAHSVAEPGPAMAALFYSAIFQRREALTKSVAYERALVEEAVARAHADRVEYLELQVDPFAVAPPPYAATPGPPAPRSPTGTIAPTALADAGERLRLLGAAAARANARLPEGERVEVRFLLALSRTKERTRDVLPLAFALADARPDLVAGVQLVGNEYPSAATGAHPFEPLALVTALHARYPRVHVALHAGEHPTDDDHVERALAAGAERLGHATNATLGRDDVRLLRERGALVEACLTSNERLLGVAPARHPFLALLHAGVAVSLNSDDAGVFGVDLDEEFARAAEAGASGADLLALARASLEHAFVDGTTRARLVARWERDAAAWARSAAR